MTFAGDHLRLFKHENLQHVPAETPESLVDSLGSAPKTI